MSKVGDKLKDFVLRDQDNQELKSENLKGKRILLSFHPLAFTSVCTKQMKSLEDNYETFEQLNTVPLGISIDQPFAKGAWAREMGLEKVRLLADFWPHGEVARSLDIFLEDKGVSGRVNIIVDEQGKIIFIKNYDIPQLPDINEILEFLKK